MKLFKDFLIEAGGESAGKMEIVKTPLEKAREYADILFKKAGKDLDKEIPEFDKNYEYAKSNAKLGKTKRKDMPVIDDTDVKKLQKDLSTGRIDIAKPFYKRTNVKDPFPEGLTGEKAKYFLENGLKINDGSEKDDIVKVTQETENVGNLKPIQQQIYFDKSIGETAKSGVEKTRSFLSSTFFVVSSDNRIIDGHHRFLSGILIDPNMKVKVLRIALPINKLLPLTLAYGDAIGNVRNK